MPKAKLPTPLKKKVYGSVKTDLGWISFAVSGKGLMQTKFMYENRKQALDAILKIVPDAVKDDQDILIKWKKFFVKYFQGKITDVSCVPIDKMNWTIFQKKVYSKTIKIPFGKKYTYGHIASLINKPQASRAVGMAMRVNPVAPVVPCHRIVGANNEHFGFSANGGVDLKLKMLEIEKKNL